MYYSVIGMIFNRTINLYVQFYVNGSCFVYYTKIKSEISLYNCTLKDL